EGVDASFRLRQVDEPAVGPDERDVRGQILQPPPAALVAVQHAFRGGEPHPLAGYRHRAEIRVGGRGFRPPAPFVEAEEGPSVADGPDRALRAAEVADRSLGEGFPEDQAIFAQLADRALDGPDPDPLA